MSTFYFHNIHFKIFASLFNFEAYLKSKNFAFGILTLGIDFFKLILINKNVSLSTAPLILIFIFIQIFILKILYFNYYQNETLEYIINIKIIRS